MTEKPYIKSDRKSDFYRIVEITFLILFSIYVLYSAAAQIFPWEHLSFFEGRAKEFSTGFVEKSTGMSVEIPAQSKPELFSKGITIVGTLPDYINSHDYMRLYMAHQNVSVLIDGTERTSFRSPKYGWKNAPSNYSLFVPLEKTDAGKSVEISFDSDMPAYASRIGMIYIGTYSQIISTLLHVAGTSVMFAIGGLVLGICLLVAGVFYGRKANVSSLLYIGTFMLCISLWILNESVLRQFLFSNLTATMYTIVFSLAFGCVPWALFMCEMQYKRYSRIYYSIAVVSIATTVFSVLAYGFGWISLTNILKIDHIEIGIMIATMIFTFVRDKIKSNPTYLGKAFSIGILIFMFCIIYEIVSIWTRDNYIRGTATGFGLFVFLVCMTITVVDYIVKANFDRQQEFIDVTVKNLQLVMEHQKIQTNVIFTLASVIESRDETTGAHVKNTSNYVRFIGNKLLEKGEFKEILTPEYVNILATAAPLHDVGKVKVPDAILTKPGKLTDQEYRQIQNHTIYGFEMLDDILKHIGTNTYLEVAREIALNHHEHFDGKGFPYRLLGDEIPLSARIMSVADVVDALLSERQYKPAFSFEKTYEIMSVESGKQFDPIVLAALLDNWEEFKAFSKKIQSSDQE